MARPPRRLTTVLLALAFSAPAAAGDAAALAGRPHWRRNLFLRVLDDQKFLFTTWWPAEVRRPSFVLPLAGAAAAAQGAERGGFDELRWQRAFAERTAGGGQDAAGVFSRLGDRPTAILLVGTTWLASRWAGNVRMQRASSLSAEALIDAGLYSTLLKRVSGRARPGEAAGSANSFPSGHATGAFAVATVLSGEFGEKRWVPWLAYGTAGLVAASRVSLGRHFPSDVLAGAVLGHSMGRMVLHREGAAAEPAAAWGRFEPQFDPESGGLGLAWRYEWTSGAGN
jgi:membrane-associated phospholipid phosphatase